MVVYPYLENLAFFTKTQARSLEGEWGVLQRGRGTAAVYLVHQGLGSGAMFWVQLHTADSKT
jgi:hypothetical protein